MISNGEKRKRSKVLATRAKSKENKAKSEGCKAMSEGRRRWLYLAVKKAIGIIKRNNMINMVIFIV